MRTLPYLKIMPAAVVLGSLMLNAGPLYETRDKEPMVLLGGKAGADVPGFRGAPIDALFLFAYKSGAWSMIPFQIDERVELDDPHLSKEQGDRKRHFYAIANTNPKYARADTAEGFDKDDELSFMIGDLGDKAPKNSWIADADSEKYPRIEIVLTDPRDDTQKAWGYLYRSATLTMPVEVATQYGMQYDPVQDLIQSDMYQMKMGQEKGFIRDIIINPPYGTGIDFFDAQKVRMNGYIGIGTFPLYFGRNDASSATEAILYYWPSDTFQAYSANPVVRVIRERRYSLGFFGISIANTEFYLKTFNYPYSGVFEGGAQLHPDSLKQAFNDPTINIEIEIDYIRQSWDFNANASGMSFHSENVNDVTIDGTPDTPDRTLDTGGRDSLQTWTMGTGPQGTLYTYFEFPVSNWNRFQLYYHDDKSGGQADDDIVNADDTGFEFGSYGDHGLQFFQDTHSPDEVINLDFDFKVFLLPASQTHEMGETLTEWMKNPITHKSVSQLYQPVSVKSEKYDMPVFQLAPNHPNPFNPMTAIRFQLPEAGMVRLEVFDITGRSVRVLMDMIQSAGLHEVTFDASGLESGVYYYRLQSGNRAETRKMVMIK